MRAQPLLDRTVGEEVGRERPVRGRRAPVGDAVPGVLHDGEGTVGTPAERPGGLVVDLHDDLRQPRQGEEQGVVDAAEEPLGEIGGGGVAQRQDDGGVVRLRSGALGGEGQPQQGHVPVPPAHLVPQPGTVPGGVGGQLPGLGEGPAHAPVPPHDRRFVGDGEHGGEADPEPADGAVRRLGVPLRGGPQRGQRLDAGRVQRGTGVRGHEHAVAEGEPQPPRHVCPRGGVGGVLGQLDDEPVPVPPEDQVLLGVGVLPEPGGAGRPGVEDTATQTGGAEGVGALGRRPDELAHVDSPLRREDEGTARNREAINADGEGRR